MAQLAANRVASSGVMIQYRERLARAFQMRIDGHSLSQIMDATGIDKADLSRKFSSYKTEAIAELREELFEQQTHRLMELWRNAAEDVRKFVPVTDSNGNPIVVPVLNEAGQHVLDEAGQPLTEYMRDFGVHLNAVNVAARLTERIAKHFGLDAPDKTLLMNSGEDRTITWRIVDAKDGRMVEYPEQPEQPAEPLPDSIGATSAESHVINGVEVVTYTIPDEPEEKPLTVLRVPEPPRVEYHDSGHAPDLTAL